MRVPNPSPVLDKNRAPMGPAILSSTGAGVCRKAPRAFPDSGSVLDKFQSAKTDFYTPPVGRGWGVGSVVVGSAFGAPQILPQSAPKPFKIRVWGPLD